MTDKEKVPKHGQTYGTISLTNPTPMGTTHNKAIYIDGIGYVCVNGSLVGVIGGDLVYDAQATATSSTTWPADPPAQDEALPLNSATYVRGEWKASNPSNYFQFVGPGNSADGNNHLVPVSAPSGVAQVAYVYVWIWQGGTGWVKQSRQFTYVSKRKTNCNDEEP